MNSFLFVCFTPLTHFSMQSKGGFREGDSLLSFPIGPTCKVRIACPSNTWGYRSCNESAWPSMCHSSVMVPSTFQLRERCSKHYTIPTFLKHNQEWGGWRLNPLTFFSQSVVLLLDCHMTLALCSLPLSPLHLEVISTLLISRHSKSTIHFAWSLRG